MFDQLAVMCVFGKQISVFAPGACPPSILIAKFIDRPACHTDPAFLDDLWVASVLQDHVFQEIVDQVIDRFLSGHQAAVLLFNLTLLNQTVDHFFTTRSAVVIAVPDRAEDPAVGERRNHL